MSDTPEASKASVQQVQFPTDPPQVEAGPGILRREDMLDASVEVEVLLGKKRVTIRDLIGLHVGGVLDFPTTPDQPLEIQIPGMVLGTGTIRILEGDRLGLQIREWRA